MVVRAVYKLHGARLFLLRARAGPSGEGDCVLARPTALWGAESAPEWERGFPAACAASTDMEQLAGCSLLRQAQMQGRHGVVRVSEPGFGVAAMGFAAAELFFGVIWLNSSRSCWWLSDSLSQLGTGRGAGSP